MRETTFHVKLDDDIWFEVSQTNDLVYNLRKALKNAQYKQVYHTSSLRMKKLEYYGDV